NAEDRSFRAVVSSETPVPTYDVGSFEVVDEILIASGGEFPRSFPVLTDHELSVDRAVGVASDARIEGSAWLAMVHLGNDTYSREIGDKVAAGILHAMSIGYRILSWVYVRPGQSEMVAGRLFRNDGPRTMRVVDSWKVHEVSIVTIGADPAALI